MLTFTVDASCLNQQNFLFAAHKNDLVQLLLPYQFNREYSCQNFAFFKLTFSAWMNNLKCNQIFKVGCFGTLISFAFKDGAFYLKSETDLLHDIYSHTSLGHT